MSGAVLLSSVDRERLDWLLNSLPAEQAGQGRALRELLALAQVCAPAAIPPDVVTMGARVCVALGAAGEESILTLSLPDEILPDELSSDELSSGAMRADDPQVSVLSPVGSALLGRRVGDSVAWVGPDGIAGRLTVLELWYQPERSGELRRWKGYPPNCVNAESRRILLSDMRLARTDAAHLLCWPALLLLVMWLLPSHMGLSLPGMLVTTLILGPLSAIGALHLLPQACWLYGVELAESGFTHRCPLRHARFIRYACIERIVAHTCREGSGSLSSVLYIDSPDGDVKIDGLILSRTDLAAALDGLPGFRRQAWRACKLDGAGAGYWRPTRTVIFARVPVPPRGRS
jgi:regulator of nucleoside diphosphate kinase